jgi:hypothetical protein
MTLQHNYGLTSLTGLESLATLTDQYVGGLQLFNNTALENVDALAALTDVGSVISLSSNDALTDLDGLGQVTGAICSITLDRNPSLTSLAGLAGLEGFSPMSGQNACNPFTGNRVRISDNDALQSLSGLEWMVSVYALDVSNNAQLPNLIGLDNLTTVTGELRIGNAISSTSTQGIISLAGLGSLTTIGGSLVIESNPNLTTLAPLSSLTALHSLIISTSPALADLDGLEGLQSLTTVTLGRLNYGAVPTIPIPPSEDLPALESLDGLANLTTLGTFNGFHLRNGLSLAPLANARISSPNTGVYWSFRQSFVSDVDAIVADGVVASFSFRESGTTTGDLSGLESLTTLTGELALVRTGLTTLNGLQGLTAAPYVTIDDNDALTTLAGFDNLTTLSQLQVTNNDVLKQCEALAFRDDLVNNHGFTGPSVVTNNTGLGVCE